MRRNTRAREGFLFFFNDTATTEIYTLSLPDALPICLRLLVRRGLHALRRDRRRLLRPQPGGRARRVPLRARPPGCRSEEHTSELQSRSDVGCRLLLEKKKQLGLERVNGVLHLAPWPR